MTDNDKGILLSVRNFISILFNVGILQNNHVLEPLEFR